MKKTHYTTNFKRYFALLLVVLIVAACKKKEPTYEELIQGPWIVDRGQHLPPEVDPQFYVQYQVEIKDNEWHQLDLSETYPMFIFGDTLYINEFGYIQRFYIEELTASHFKLVFTDMNFTTTPVTTYVGNR